MGPVWARHEAVRHRHAPQIEPLGESVQHPLPHADNTWTCRWHWCEGCVDNPLQARTGNCMLSEWLAVRTAIVLLDPR